MNIPSKQAIVEIASTSGDRDILYSYVANENDHTVNKFAILRRYYAVILGRKAVHTFFFSKSRFF